MTTDMHMARRAIHDKLASQLAAAQARLAPTEGAENHATLKNQRARARHISTCNKFPLTAIQA